MFRLKLFAYIFKNITAAIYNLGMGIRRNVIVGNNIHIFLFSEYEILSLFFIKSKLIEEIKVSIENDNNTEYFNVIFLCSFFL